ncbi:hypothetical protein FBF26_03665 [Candidatus Saccharibacteria bacterium oral taxon 488]|nr:hypothetical protein FBF26_03665 [Candidatus Saccharibacteria bacterium oral taxon 488]
MSGAHFKKFDDKFCLVLIRLQNRVPTIFRIHLDTAKTIVRTAHPITELRVTNLRTNHPTHNVAHLIFGAFRFQILRLLRRVKLAPIILKSSVLQRVYLLLANHAIHILKGDA